MEARQAPAAVAGTVLTPRVLVGRKLAVAPASGAAAQAHAITITAVAAARGCRTDSGMRTIALVVEGSVDRTLGPEARHPRNTRGAFRVSPVGGLLVSVRAQGVGDLQWLEYRRLTRAQAEEIILEAFVTAGERLLAASPA